MKKLSAQFKESLYGFLFSSLRKSSGLLGDELWVSHENVFGYSLRRSLDILHEYHWGIFKAPMVSKELGGFYQDRFYQEGLVIFYEKDVSVFYDKIFRFSMIFLCSSERISSGLPRKNLKHFYEKNFSSSRRKLPVLPRENLSSYR